ncbi:helix-turn-helix domain-containing protein [Mucilaginibacter sp. SP1R1]|uniref:helix-turn-helix domain-containing protein n=1 Tax=Mucilaginibacter sp. SP1R1 TaxID=2723091 RepID=UPI00160E8D94|nr:helix-turn-helix domain-containing protein [Mucilaginibacter sp. SP1R1]MBB6151155.1 transcriptional regulator with XRE-family HTH domain [Mucilaginibacter sp. SP1R1]
MHGKIDYPVIGYDSNNAGSISNGSDSNYGQILERVVRRDRMGISELARRLNVSRRTIYNWFETDNLSIDIISKIGFVIGHDFSNEFPEEFAKTRNYVNDDHLGDAQSSTENPSNAIYYWMDRYIKLLEKFNAVLSHEIKDHESVV